MEFNNEFWFNQKLLAKKGVNEDGEIIIVFNINQELHIGAVKILSSWLEEQYNKSSL